VKPFYLSNRLPFKFNLYRYIKVFVDLKGGNCDSDFWIKRGTALLLALST
jgi:hypothetical protein